MKNLLKPTYKQNKLAFTVAEIMITLTIIGLVATLTLIVTNGKSDLIKRHLYNAAIGTFSTISKEIYERSSDKALPKSNSELCLEILKLVNTIGDASCNLRTQTVFTDNKIALTLSNGMKYYNYGISEDEITDCRTSTATIRLINDADDFIDCVPTSGGSGIVYKLTSDINLQGKTYAAKNTFSGTLDGNGYSIMNYDALSGLFVATSGATIRNLTLSGANISGTGTCGALAGTATSTTISKVGAINGNVTGRIAGGLVGSSSSSSLTNCFATTSVSVSNTSGEANGGGLIGTVTGGTSITNSYAASGVSSTTSTTPPLIYLGGLIGKAASASISGSYWNNELIATSSGGGIGITTAQMEKASTFSAWDSSIWNIKDGQAPLLQAFDVPSEYYSFFLDIDGKHKNTILNEDIFKFDVFPLLNLIVPGLGSPAAENSKILSTSVSYKDASGSTIWLKKEIGYRQAACITGLIPQTHEYCLGKGVIITPKETIASPAYTKSALCTDTSECEVIINKP